MRSQAGFSLMELSIALIIIGLVMVPFFAKEKHDALMSRIGTTDSQLNAKLPKAIDDYYFATGYYPCPADPTLNENDANFGVEACASPHVVNAAEPTVLQGMIPFQTLNIPRQMSLDGYNNRITYAVTRDHTPPSGLGPDGTNGVIIISGYLAQTADPSSPQIDGNGDMIVGNDADPVGYVLISHGPNGVGAYTNNGLMAKACPTATPLPPESENCDRDKTFFNHTFARSAKTDQLYDDKIKYQKAASSRMFRLPAGSTAMLSVQAYYGINTKDPRYPVDVNGTVRVEGKVHSLDYCPSNNKTDCFTADIIGGSGIQCDYSTDTSSPNGFMTGIGKAKAKCSSAHKGLKPMTCGTNEVVTGIDANGSPICKVL